MSNSRSVTALLLCAMFILGGCSSQKGPTPEEEKLFVEAYVRLALAAQEYRDDPDSLAASRRAVLGELGLDEGQFQALAKKLEAYPERWVVIWEQIVERIKREQVKKGG